MSSGRTKYLLKIREKKISSKQSLSDEEIVDVIKSSFSSGLPVTETYKTFINSLFSERLDALYERLFLTPSMLIVDENSFKKVFLYLRSTMTFSFEVKIVEDIIKYNPDLLLEKFPSIAENFNHHHWMSVLRKIRIKSHRDAIDIIENRNSFWYTDKAFLKALRVNKKSFLKENQFFIKLLERELIKRISISNETA